jgi:hypothetical protein
MMMYSRKGKPCCFWCLRLATYAIHYASGGLVVYSYQCTQHKHASSKPLADSSSSEKTQEIKP